MNEELRKIIEKANECLSDAKYLLEGDRTEAAANRAYYAIFNAVQGLLLNINVLVKTHKGIHVKFNEHFIKTKVFDIELGQILDSVSALRQEADYDFGFEVLSDDAKRAIEKAEYFLTTVKSYLEDLENK